MAENTVEVALDHCKEESSIKLSSIIVMVAKDAIVDLNAPFPQEKYNIIRAGINSADPHANNAWLYAAGQRLATLINQYIFWQQCKKLQE